MVRIAILGSGNGALASAYEWASRGHVVSLWGVPEHGPSIERIAQTGVVEALGLFEGTVHVRYAGRDLGVALEGAELALVVAPAYAHTTMAESLRGHLRRDLAIAIVPSACAGAVVVKRVLGLDLIDDTYLIGETSTLPYGCRITAPGVVRVTTRVKDGLYAAALPSRRTAELVALLSAVWPQVEPARNVLQTSLQNGNPVLHPAIMLLNACRIENTGGDFLFYTDGVTPASARLIETVDRERIAIGRALGLDVIPDPELGLRQGYLSEATYLRGYNRGIGFAGSRAPTTLTFRYLTEDVPYGLVFMSELARQFGVPTPAIDTVISLASILMDTDYRASSERLPRDLGLGELTPEFLACL